jgi:hypothetical protein
VKASISHYEQNLNKVAHWTALGPGFMQRTRNTIAVSAALLSTSDFGPCIPFLISVDNGLAGLTGEAGMASLRMG